MMTPEEDTRLGLNARHVVTRALDRITSGCLQAHWLEVNVLILAGPLVP